MRLAWTARDSVKFEKYSDLVLSVRSHNYTLHTKTAIEQPWQITFVLRN